MQDYVTAADLLTIWCLTWSTGFLTAALLGLPDTNAQLTMKKTAVVCSAASLAGYLVLLVASGSSLMFWAAVTLAAALTWATFSLRAAIQRDQAASLNEAAGHKA